MAKSKAREYVWLQCGDCGVELEVINIEPLEIALAPEEEEDWGE